MPNQYFKEENKIFYILPQQKAQFFEINPKSMFAKE